MKMPSVALYLTDEDYVNFIKLSEDRRKERKHKAVLALKGDLK